MNITVFGASGYLGSHLVERLLSEGHKVLALVHRGKGLLGEHSINHENIKIEKIDICDSISVEKVCKKADMIFNLSSGSIPHSSNINPKLDLQINLFGAINILNATKKSAGKKVIMISSYNFISSRHTYLLINLFQQFIIRFILNIITKKIKV